MSEDTAQPVNINELRNPIAEKISVHMVPLLEIVKALPASWERTEALRKLTRAIEHLDRLLTQNWREKYPHYNARVKNVE